MKLHATLLTIALPAALMLAACGPKEVDVPAKPVEVPKPAAPVAPQAAAPAPAAPAAQAPVDTPIKPAAPAGTPIAQGAGPIQQGAKRPPMPSDPMKAKDANGNNMIHLVAERGNKDVLETLLMRGSEIDPLNNFGQSPLHLAIIKGHANTANVLLERGANPNLKDKDGKSPLDYAAGKTELENLLMSKGAKK